MRSSSRRSDDADVIRARLRALLAERDRPGGWVPEDAPDAEDWTGDDFDEDTEPPGPDAGEEPSLPSGVGRHRSPAPTVRWSAGVGGARSLWLAGLAAALLLIAWTWVDRPQVEPAPAAPTGSTAGPTPAAPSVGEVAETSSTVVVSVVGLVARPGLVTLPSGSRVADAVAAAGGLLPEADPAAVNLAAVVTDGQQIAVGVPGTAGGAPGQGSGSAAGRVNLNTATAPELDALPGLGPVLAQRIVDHRERHGPFRSVEELDDVTGIGPAIAADLTDLVTV